MKKCKFEKKYNHGLNEKNNYELKRCMRDGSLRYCKSSCCVHFKTTFFYKLSNKLKEVF